MLVGAMFSFSAEWKPRFKFWKLEFVTRNSETDDVPSCCETMPSEQWGRSWTTISLWLVKLDSMIMSAKNQMNPSGGWGCSALQMRQQKHRNHTSLAHSRTIALVVSLLVTVAACTGMSFRWFWHGEKALRPIVHGECNGLLWQSVKLDLPLLYIISQDPPGRFQRFFYLNQWKDINRYLEERLNIFISFIWKAIK